MIIRSQRKVCPFEENPNLKRISSSGERLDINDLDEFDNEVHEKLKQLLNEVKNMERISTARLDLPPYVMISLFKDLIAISEGRAIYLSDLSESFVKSLKDGLKEIKYSPSKVNAPKNANAAKINKSKEKVQNAINLLRLEGKDITPYAVAKTANISYNTAKKYL